MLRYCLSQDHSETGLRSLVVTVFYLCLRQNIVFQIKIQVLDNTLAPRKYLIFLKTSMIKRNFILMKGPEGRDEGGKGEEGVVCIG